MVAVGRDTPLSESMELVAIFEQAAARLTTKAGSVVVKYVGIFARWVVGHVQAVFNVFDMWLDGALAA